MAYCGYITNLKNVRKHPNADRLMLADCFGNTVVVDLNAKEGDIGLYLPVDGQVSVEFGEKNNLLRKKDDAGNSIGGYLDPNKRNIKAIKLRGEKSDGLFLGLESLAYTGVDIATLTAGTPITEVNGHEICRKYIPKSNRTPKEYHGNKTRKHKDPIAPLFMEHADTEQLAYHLGEFKPGDRIEITLKMHGTSQRTAYMPCLKEYEDSVAADIYNWFAHGINKYFHKNIEDYHDGEPVYDWGHVSGTRRTVLEDYEGGYYGSNEFREEHSKIFEGKLHKGETVYYEVVGFTHTGVPIMSDANNRKMNDKAFVKQYGETTTFSYGCDPDGCKAEELFKLVVNPEDNAEGRLVMKPQSDLYVYRMTMTNEDGDVVEYTPEYMRYRCEQMAVKTVPVFATAVVNYDGSLTWWNEVGDEDMGHICIGEEVDGDPYNWQFNPGECVLNLAEKFYDGPDPIGKTHVREGVVVRITNRPKFTAYKHKNHTFKMLSGIITEAIADGVADVTDEDILSEL